MSTLGKLTLLVLASFAIFALTMLPIDATHSAFGRGEKLWTAALRPDWSWSAMSLSRVAQAISTETVVGLAAWVAVVLRLAYRTDDEV